jgi:citrate lyase subunit beta / citryl-CoA lyase
MPTHRWRSALFAPANRPELVPKLPRSGPDVVVLDLEDAVPPAEKASARSQARAAALALLELPHPPAVLVRVNSTRTEWFAGDVAGAAVAGLTAIVLPKVERADDLATALDALDRAGVPEAGVVAGLETARGVADARELLSAPGVIACYFGAEDYIADMGGVRRDDNVEVQVARSLVALGARLAGIAALDMVVTRFGDDERFTREAAEARAMGYAGKLCIHPAQVPLANAAFTPSPDDVARARRLLVAYDEATAEGRASIAFEGQMVDEPLAARARQVLQAAEADRPAPVSASGSGAVPHPGGRLRR